MWAIYGSNLRTVCSDNFRAHIKEKTNKHKVITDLKECQCRRRAELEMTTKKMSLQAVLHQLSNTLLELAPVEERAEFCRLAVMTHTDDSWNAQYSDIIIPLSAIRILEVSSPVPWWKIAIWDAKWRTQRVTILFSFLFLAIWPI